MKNNLRNLNLPDKKERHRRFGSVPSTIGVKPCNKDEMIDLQNTPDDFLFDLQSVGICNVQHPITLQSSHSPKIQNTIGTFKMITSLDSNAKGINMSRLTEQLDHYYQEGWTVDFQNLYTFTKELTERMDQLTAEVEVSFPWFFERNAPKSDKTGLMKAVGSIKVRYDNKNGFSHEAQLSVGVTTLCPCSKEISEYSAHNQRGFVTMAIELYDPLHCEKDWKATLLHAAESNASAMIHPVLKRPDEKFVTEKAYENPRFVEDMVRLIAADLYEMDFVKRFTVECRNEESIHLHDAIAKVSYQK
ncbi:GTP cyclohydrolase FolE2 [Shouchella clausii]|uniref:GTP cyclohydrolase FolE2 n=1 Tax=Shouchella clausii TaxID=79880 RepID=UPI000BA69684|nr:GTP cyclohydrolase FolE2 [Shouchella clausii]PAD94089.1 GTP cyclohydrolase I FolE2 [Shouchella clausii]